MKYTPRKATDKSRAYILNTFVDGRALDIIIEHYEAGHPLRYLPLTNTLIFEWVNEYGTSEKLVYRLSAWFAPECEDFIIDLILPCLED